MNKLLYLSLMGLVIFSGCGKPNDPETLGPGTNSGGYAILKKYPTTGYAQDVVKKDTLLYIVQGEGGLMIVNIKDILNPQTVSITTENVRGYSAKLEIKDSVVYVAAGTFGVTVINAANPLAPIVTVSNLNIKPARNFYIIGDYLFSAISEQGVNIAEISYPEQPDIRGGVVTPGYAYGLTVTSDTSKLIVACGEMGLTIYDISDFQNGFGNYPKIGYCDTPGYAQNVVIRESQSIAFMACGTYGLQIVDYSDTSNVYVTGSYDGPGYAKDIILKNNLVYLAAQLGGVQIIDVTDLTNPKLVGEVKTDFAQGLDVDDDYIYLADEMQGLIIISVPK